MDTPMETQPAHGNYVCDGYTVRYIPQGTPPDAIKTALCVGRQNFQVGG